MKLKFKILYTINYLALATMSLVTGMSLGDSNYNWLDALTLLFTTVLILSLFFLGKWVKADRYKENFKNVVDLSEYRRRKAS